MDQPLVPKGSSIQQYSPRDKPEGAVFISQRGVLEIMWGMIDKWQPRSQMWPFKEGLGLLGGASALTGVVMMQVMRKKMKLFTFGRGISFISTVPIPVAMSMAIHHSFITQKILLQDIRCPACTETRSALVQTTTGFVQPLILALVSNAALAKTRMSYPLPKVSQPVELSKAFFKLLRPHQGTLTVLLVVNFIAAVTVCHYEYQATDLLINTLQKGEF